MEPGCLLLSCDSCNQLMGRRDVTFECATCDYKCHAKCDKRFFEVKDRIADVTYKNFEKLGYLWFCTSCISELTWRKRDDRTILNEIKILGEKVESIEKALSPRESTASYASIVKTEPERALVITHSDKKMSSKKMAKIVSKSIDPVFAKVSNLHVLENKCVIKTTLNEENFETFAKKIENVLGKGSNARPIKKRKPRLKIIGNIHIEENDYNETTLLEFIVKQNNLSHDEIEIKSVRKAEAKTGLSDQIIIETTPRVYNMILKDGHIIVGFTRCKVFDANIVPRCFKCARLGHFEKNCASSTVCCPKCSGKHKLKECKSKELKCINCEITNKNSKHQVNVKHAAFDRNCPTSAHRTKVLRSFFEDENS